jgi:excisionase family DNA binding protein
MESTSPFHPLSETAKRGRSTNQCDDTPSSEQSSSSMRATWRKSRTGGAHVECDTRKALGGILHTLPEVAKFLRVSVKTIRRLIDEGKLKSIKVRGAVRVWDRDLAAYLQKLAA